ncbi:MAG: sigma-70 family RNA polymerase sigma factor, partial [Planctomycetota bacterium]
MPTPETRPSILIRLRDHSDRDAWREFENVYRGVVVRVANRHGLQHADASDLGQDVLIKVSQNIHRFDHDPAHAKFRTWFGTLIRSALVDRFRRAPRDVASGLDEIRAQLESLPAEDPGEWQRTIDTETRNE